MAATQALFDISLLPAPLQQPVAEAFGRGDYGTAIASIRAHFASDEPRDANTLMCLAVSMVEATRSGPFEQLALHCGEALTLLGEARRRGAPSDLLRTTRTRIKRIQKSDKELEALEATESKMLDATTLNRTKNRAYALADRGGTSERLVSARLWQVLYRHALALPDAVSLTDRIYAFTRAGLQFAQGGRFDLAYPYLVAIVDTGKPGSGYESWMVEYAFRELLIQAAMDDERGQFDQLWWRAVQALRTYGTYFPYARPSQDQFLAHALAFGLPDICRHLVAIIEEYRPKRSVSADVRATLVQAQAYLAESKINARP
jgi:hypothetical protein